MLRLGLGLTLAVLALDQISKAWLIELMAANGGVSEITPFFNLVMAWNRGISFGMLNREMPWQNFVLAALAFAVVVVLLVWLWRTRQPWPATGIGLVAGGALGNAIDRIRFGAVADFFDFHLFGYHWPAFNVADSAIVVGVGLLLLDNLSTGTKKG